MKEVGRSTKLFLLGAAAPRTLCCSWGASSPPDPVAGGLQPPVPPCIPRGSASRALRFFLVPRSWYQDPGTKILARPGMARHGNVWHGTDPQGTARKYLARHGSTRSWHGTARDVPDNSLNCVQDRNENYPSATPASVEILLGHFLIFIGLFGVRRGFKMILSHRAPSSLNMSSYRAIWTHFRPNFIFFGPKNLRLPKIQTFPKMPISSSSHSHKYLTYMGR